MMGTSEALESHTGHRECSDFRLSREERDHIAGHALDSIERWALSLAASVRDGVEAPIASTEARKIAALSNLLSDIGWEREAPDPPKVLPRDVPWVLGELFPTAQLRPWLEEWVEEDSKALINPEKLGSGVLLLARLEKWMASHGN